jgi:hypothetical protein
VILKLKHFVNITHLFRLMCLSFLFYKLCDKTHEVRSIVNYPHTYDGNNNYMYSIASLSVIGISTDVIKKLPYYVVNNTQLPKANVLITFVNDAFFV